MAIKHYVDEIPKTDNRVYIISTTDGKSTIRDITEYEQKGSTFNATDVNCTCILECNYAKSGTVHALTTLNTMSENIKFFATAAFNKGDTFTFNGTAVTAQTTDGQSLGKNFFKANAIVECRRRGNTLYFASSNKSIVDDTTGSAYHLGMENGILYIEEV